MTRPTDMQALDDEWASEVDPTIPPDQAPRGAPPDLSTLPIAGITRRRVAVAIGVLLAAWIVLLFARQVGDAAAASTRADVLLASNAQQSARVAALSRELQQIQRARYIDQQARGYGLGMRREVAFTLDPHAPPLPSDAPGSASVRLGSATDDGSPLDHWLTLLFGSGD
jgi:cell division protein FtsB